MINPHGSCGHYIESAEHFLLHCPQFSNERRTLLSATDNTDHKLEENFSPLRHKLYSFKLHHSIQTTALRFLMLQFNLSYRLKDLMSHFLISCT